MAIDISTELSIIESAQLGQEVRMAIVSAAEKIGADTSADISAELAIIRTGRYGINIRRAIYNALYELSVAFPTPVANIESPAGTTQRVVFGEFTAPSGIVEEMESD